MSFSQPCMFHVEETSFVVYWPILSFKCMLGCTFNFVFSKFLQLTMTSYQTWTYLFAKSMLVFQVPSAGLRFRLKREIVSRCRTLSTFNWSFLHLMATLSTIKEEWKNITPWRLRCQRKIHHCYQKPTALYLNLKKAQLLKHRSLHLGATMPQGPWKKDERSFQEFKNDK